MFTPKRLRPLIAYLSQYSCFYLFPDTALPLGSDGTIRAHKMFLAYMHVVADMYIDGGSGPGVPRVNGVHTHNAAEILGRMEQFASSVNWDKVKGLVIYDAGDRDEEVGMGAFLEGEISAVPDHLKAIVCQRQQVPAEQNNGIQNDSGDESDN